MTASAILPTLRTAIAAMDDAEGDVRYRGYLAGDLAEVHTFLDVAHLLIYGELPSAAESTAWADDVTHHTMVHEQLRHVIESFPSDAPPHAVWCSALAGLAGLYSDAARRHAPADRRLQMVRLLGKGPTIAGDAYRHRHGFPSVLPDNALSYAGDLLNLIFRRTEPRYRPHRALERALDVILIVHAEPAADVATHTVRVLSAAHGNPYWAAAAGSTACESTCTAGRVRDVLSLAREVVEGASIAEVLAAVKSGHRRLPGFERRRDRGPSSTVRALKAALHDALAASGARPLVDAALRLEAAVDAEPALELSGGRDFVTALVLDALHIDDDLVDIVLSIARMAGWLAHWEEVVSAGERQPAVPPLAYAGPPPRSLAGRAAPPPPPLARDDGGMEHEMVSV